METEATCDALAMQLREFVRGIGFSDCVIGLSGGIDSAVTAAVAVEALGAEHVHGVLLPGPYSSDHSIADAEDLAQNLGIETFTVPIVGAYEAFAEALAEACGGHLGGLAAENTQARCRMVCLMALSNAHGWLLLNTGNKSEAFMGYSTLYGDTAGAVAPLGDLYKTQVYELARWMNERARLAGAVPPIPQRSIDKPPSAELAPDQQDERALGVDYPTLDAILHLAFDEQRPIQAIVEAGYDADLVESVIVRANAAAFKRAQEPPALIVEAEGR